MSPDTSSEDCEMLRDDEGEKEKSDENEKSAENEKSDENKKSDENDKSDANERVKRSETNPASGPQPNATAPNIDILINPGQKKKREEYVGLVMNKLRDFFKDKNSTLIYPNLFRLLWYRHIQRMICEYKKLVRYSSIPCFDLFHMTEEHTHILKYCEWAGEEVPCQVKNQQTQYLILYLPGLE